MRPLSLRRAMEEDRGAGAGAIVGSEPEEHQGTVARLTRGSHPVRLALGGRNGVDELKKAATAGYVHVEFTETQGGTTLGVRLNRDECDLQNCDTEPPAGRVRLVGGVTLDYVRLRCTAEVDLTTFAGSGRLDRESPAE